MNSNHTNLLLVLAGLVPAILIIIWGEFSEFNVDFWFLPTVDVSEGYVLFAQFLIAVYYLVSPVFFLLFLRRSMFRSKNLKFLFMVVGTVTSYGLLRYAEFIYDIRGLPVLEFFGNFFPLVFWSLPLVSTAAIALILSAGSQRDSVK